MLRRGTSAHDARSWTRPSNALGAELSIDTNPAFVRIAGSVIRRSLEPMLALVSELLHSPTFPEAELEQLRRESVAALLELTDNDQGLCAVQFRRTLVPRPPLRAQRTGHARLDPSPSSTPRCGALSRGAGQARALVTFSARITRAEAEALAARHLDSPERA
jgi:hypothetical protein